MKRPTARDFDKGDIRTTYDAINKRDELIKALENYIDYLEQDKVKTLNIDDVSNQRELLIDFFMHFRDKGEQNIGMTIEQFVDDYLSNL